MQDPLVQDYPLILPRAGFIQSSAGYPSGSIHSLDATPGSSSLEVVEPPTILDSQVTSLGRHQLEPHKQPQDEHTTLKLVGAVDPAAELVTAEPLISPRVKPIHNLIKQMENQRNDQQPAADGPEAIGGSSSGSLSRDKSLAESSVIGRRTSFEGTDERCVGHATYFR